MKKLLISFILFVISIPASACRVSVYSDIDKAQMIFEGIVVGVELSGFEEYLAEKYSEDKFSINKYPDLILSSTEWHKLDVFVTKSIKGKVEAGKVISVEAGGCGVQYPKLKNIGVFHYFPEKNYVMPRYE